MSSVISFALADIAAKGGDFTLASTLIAWAANGQAIRGEKREGQNLLNSGSIGHSAWHCDLMLFDRSAYGGGPHAL